MVKYLLDALSLLQPSTANDGADAPQSTEQSVLIMIGQALTTAVTVSPEQAGRRRNIFAIAAALPPAPPSISAASITQSPSRITAVMSDVACYGQPHDSYLAAYVATTKDKDEEWKRYCSSKCLDSHRRDLPSPRS